MRSPTHRLSPSRIINAHSSRTQTSYPTVYHGLPVNLLQPQSVRRTYLAFLGRINPDKGPERAIRIARQAGMPLKIPTKVDQEDQTYFSKIIQPMIDGRPLRCRRRSDEAQKADFLSERLLCLYPSTGPSIRPCDDRGNGLRNSRGRFQPKIVPRIVDHGVTSVHRGSTNRKLSQPWTEFTRPRGGWFGLIFKSPSQHAAWRSNVLISLATWRPDLREVACCAAVVRNASKAAESCVIVYC